MQALKKILELEKNIDKESVEFVNELIEEDQDIDRISIGKIKKLADIMNLTLDETFAKLKYYDKK